MCHCVFSSFLLTAKRFKKVMIRSARFFLEFIVNYMHTIILKYCQKVFISGLKGILEGDSHEYWFCTLYQLICEFSIYFFANYVSIQCLYICLEIGMSYMLPKKLIENY